MWHVSHAITNYTIKKKNTYIYKYLENNKLGAG